MFIILKIVTGCKQVLAELTEVKRDEHGVEQVDTVRRVAVNGPIFWKKNKVDSVKIHLQSTRWEG